MHETWLAVLEDEFEQSYMQSLRNFLLQEKKKFSIFPPTNEIFNAFNLTPFNEVSVVILGQDPYHGKNQAHGLCFSVNKNIPIPPSLKNIYKELKEDTHFLIPNHGCLLDWAKQGVLLLNSTLTVRAHCPNSHREKGWETFTNKVITLLNENKTNLVFLLWGRHAQEKKTLLNDQKHLVLSAAHPSPFSADRGFFGCKHFSKTNAYLEKNHKNLIDWNLKNI